jgi:DNA-binding NtrC family response regulator
MTEHLSASVRRLVQIHGHTTSHVLVLHGTKAGRHRTARAFHEAGVRPAAPFLELDCSASEGGLDSTLRAWIAESEVARGAGEAVRDERATLFLDGVEDLSPECQRLVLILINRLAQSATFGEQLPFGRVIAGSRIDLSRAVDAGRFLPHLYDAMNKVRVELHRSRKRGTPSRSAL